MRRDIHLHNNSDVFSVICGCAVDEILEDRGRDDMQFVRRHHAVFVDLDGRESITVRIVTDEPLHDDEQREWVTRARSHLDVADGRILVIAGFDADLLEQWQEGSLADGEARVAEVSVDIGLWDIDVYSYAGSPNGNTALKRSGAVGTRFRRDHESKPFPLWLAGILAEDGAGDPGHEDDWSDVAGSIGIGSLRVDLGTRAFVGMLVHVHQRAEGDDDAPAGLRFASDTGARALPRFPMGIRADVEDARLVELARQITG